MAQENEDVEEDPSAAEFEIVPVLPPMAEVTGAEDVRDGRVGMDEEFMAGEATWGREVLEARAD